MKSVLKLLLFGSAVVGSVVERGYPDDPDLDGNSINIGGGGDKILDAEAEGNRIQIWGDNYDDCDHCGPKYPPYPPYPPVPECDGDCPPEVHEPIPEPIPEPATSIVTVVTTYTTTSCPG